METLEDRLRGKESVELVHGTWFIVQWMPDTATRELLNIGVGFVDGEGDEVSVRMLENFERISCMYDGQAQFQIELACNLSRDYIFESKSIPESIASNLSTVQQGYAQGRSVEDVLSSLFELAVPLGRPKNQSNLANRFRPKSRERVYRDAKLEIEKTLGAKSTFCIPKNPYMSYTEDATKKLFLPFRTDSRIATVASAVFAKSEKALLNVYDAHHDIQAAELQKKWEKPSVFILRSELPQAESAQTKLDNGLDAFYWLAKKQQIHVEVSVNIESLAEGVIEWSGLEPT